MQVIVRRELPHPGATLDAFEVRDGYRYQAFTTNTVYGQLAFLGARHRAHARAGAGAATELQAASAGHERPPAFKEAAAQTRARSRGSGMRRRRGQWRAGAVARQ